MKQVFVVISMILLGFSAIPAHAGESASKVSASVSNTIISGVNKDHQRVYDDVSVTGKYSWTKNFYSSVTAGLVKEFTRQREANVKDLMLGAGHSNLYYNWLYEFKLRGYGKLFIPVSKKSRNENQILASKFGLGLSKNVKSWMLGYELAGSYFLHKYRTAKNGSSNKQYGMTNSLTIGYQISSQVALNTVWSLLNFATYNESPKANFSFIQEVSYSPLSYMNLSAGLSTGGRQYKNNGEELNLSVFDVKGTEAFMSVNFSL